MTPLYQLGGGVCSSMAFDLFDDNLNDIRLVRSCHVRDRLLNAFPDFLYCGQCR